MNKILTIIRREYTTRVRKRAFIIMTFLGPLLFGTLMIAPYKLASMEDKGDKVIAVMEYDSLGNAVPQDFMLFKNIFQDKEHLRFQYLEGVDDARMQILLENTEYYGILKIDNSILEKQYADVSLYSIKQPSIEVEQHIRSNIEAHIFVKNLEKDSISPAKIGEAQAHINLVSSRLGKGGEFKEQKMVDLKRGIGYIAGFMIYFFIFFFGAMVMRGVIEEKTNRVVEVIITSVRPFQLMMGKIIGIALVGLTQFLAWIILTVGIYQFAVDTFVDSPTPVQTEQVAGQQGAANAISPENDGLAGIFDALSLIEWQFYVYLLGTFLFYFIFGYLLYGAMFGAIGSAVDSETDTQQFMLPVTLPLILSIVILIQAITNPEGQLVYWFSIIPFTSPVVMMARIPFNPPIEELLLSMGVLVATFIGMTWVAAKIYRTGILMYGKKVSYRELIKWIRFKG